MPLYEYQCRDCHNQTELLIRSSTEQPVCPKCASKKMDKLLSVSAAPVISSGSLPVCSPAPSGGCGKPQCGSGGCMFGG
ncbi:MAG: zinc ribbon domain-containing protein [Pirellulales bacterium]